MRNKALLILLVIGFSSVVAGAPELEVSPGEVNLTENSSVAVDERVTQEFNFTNTDNSTEALNVTLEDSDYLEWSDTGFNVSPEETVTVEGNITPSSPGLINQSRVIEYEFIDEFGDRTFDKNFYPEIDFLVESFWSETSISTTYFEDSFELEFNESDNSVVRIRNTGDETAYNVEVDGGEYVEFQDSSFNISEGDDVLAEYSVEVPLPEEDPTNKTNQTYSSSVEVSGTNFNSSSQSIDVFVPFQEYDTGEDSIEDLIRDYIEAQERRNELCNQDKYEDSPLCGGQLVKNNTEYVNQTPVYQTNLTEEQLRGLQYAGNETREIENNRDRINLLKNQLNQDINELQQNLSQGNQQSSKELESDIERLADEMSERNRLRNQSLQEQRQERSTEAFRNTVIFGLLMLVVLGVGGYYGYEEKIRRDKRF